MKKNKTKQCLSPTAGSWALLTTLSTNQDTPVAGRQLLGHKEVSRINTSPVLLLAARVLAALSPSVTNTVKCFLCDSITLKNWRKVPVVAWPSRHAVVSVKTVQMDSTATLCKHTRPSPKKRKHSPHSGCVIEGLHCTVCISIHINRNIVWMQLFPSCSQPDATLWLLSGCSADSLNQRPCTNALQTKRGGGSKTK